MARRPLRRAPGSTPGRSGPFCAVVPAIAGPAGEAKDLDDFIRQYDGISNPVGIAKTTRGWSALLEKTGFRIEKYELHYFPKRFIPFHRIIPDFVHRLCDRWFGTLIYFQLTKPACKAR